jgi:exodeoxyribonuclease VII small subunit
MAPLSGGLPPMSDPSDSVTRFETSMQELEAIVQQLERGELKLEESLQLFERGMALTQTCRAALDTAELKVKTLVDGQFKDQRPA